MESFSYSPLNIITLMSQGKIYDLLPKIITDVISLEDASEMWINHVCISDIRNIVEVLIYFEIF